MKTKLAALCCTLLLAASSFGCQDGRRCGGLLCNVVSSVFGVVDSLLSVFVCDGRHACHPAPARSYWVSGHWEERIDPFCNRYAVWVPGEWRSE